MMDPNQEGIDLGPEDCLSGASDPFERPQGYKKTLGNSFESAFFLFQEQKLIQESDQQSDQDCAAKNHSNQEVDNYVAEVTSSIVDGSFARTNAPTIYTASAASGTTVANSTVAPHEEPVPPLEALGERWQYVIVVLYTMTALASFMLNVVTVIVLARCRRSELRKYLINLSMSDLLLSLFSIRKLLHRTGSRTS